MYWSGASQMTEWVKPLAIKSELDTPGPTGIEVMNWHH